MRDYRGPRAVLVPVAGFLVIAAAYLLCSGAPVRVHVLSLGIAALGILLPSVLAARMATWRSRFLACAGCALAATVLWDGTSHFVIANTEPFSVLRGNPALSLVMVCGLALPALAIAWLAARPGRRGGVPPTSWNRLRDGRNGLGSRQRSLPDLSARAPPETGAHPDARVTP